MNVSMSVLIEVIFVDFLSMHLIFIEETAAKLEQSSPEMKVVNIKNKGRNVLRLKTKTGELEYDKGEARKKKQSKRSKATSKFVSSDGNNNLINQFNALSVEQCNDENVQTKSLLKSNVKVEEAQDDAKDRPLICNCKKSRCLKFY